LAKLFKDLPIDPLSKKRKKYLSKNKKREIERRDEGRNDIQLSRKKEKKVGMGNREKAESFPS